MKARPGTSASIRAIARQAGVSERTVYAVYEDKTSILVAIANHAYFGNTEAELAHAAFLETLGDVGDPVERLPLMVRQAAVGYEKGLAALARVCMLAAESDSRLKKWVTEMMEVQHRETRRAIEVAIGRELPDSDECEQVVDELEAIGSEEVYLHLTVARGWPRERYERWVVDLFLLTLDRYGMSPT